MYLGNGIWQKKMTRSEKWGIVKKVAYVTACISYATFIAFGFGMKTYQKNIDKKINTLAEENGYVESDNMDTYMKNSENVSKEEYAEYTKLQNRRDNIATAAVTGIIIAGGVATTSAVVGVVAKDKEEEMFPIY
ncbi:MAG: hypothetical protein E7379_00550 [Clostridiales bacterium]|nr:hypothetical protein [Clostridiales bacterium]